MIFGILVGFYLGGAAYQMGMELCARTWSGASPLLMLIWPAVIVDMVVHRDEDDE